MNCFIFPADDAACNAGGSCCFIQITVPAQGQTLDTLPYIEGTALPHEKIRVTVDCFPCQIAEADANGTFRIAIPFPLESGSHQVCVESCCNNCCICHDFTIQPDQPVPPPTIDTPENGSTIADPAPLIVGRGIPGYSVRVCLSGRGCQTVPVDENGEYRADFGPLPDGTYTITATQIRPDGKESESVTSVFTIDTSVFLIEAIDARRGATFRTIDVDVRVSGASGPATVYYLLLPPGSPAPTAQEIVNYSDTASLLNGTAATGQFVTDITPPQTDYTWVLTGLDSPNAPAGTTGIIDGYNYDVYLFVEFATTDSGVLAFPAAAMGMPFSSGSGTADDPFTIRNLSPSELQMYPDLLAGNPLNQPGVDENARMLENIERLVSLYEETNGRHGIENSMALHYRMTSDISLQNYAAAYGGEGWQSIGDIDGYINDQKETEHLFSGVFSGGGHTISNLSITPTASADNFVGYRGLFGGVEEGTITTLVLADVTINALASAPGQAQFGSLIAIARNPVLSNLTLRNANIVANIEPIVIGDTHAINVGGFVAEIFDGGTISNIVGQNITITVPDQSALALGGFVGFTDKFEANESYDNVQLTNLTLSGHALIGGLAGYMVYGVNLVNQVMVNQITVTAAGGESGGLIGRLYIYSGTGDCLIQNSSVQNISVFLNGLGDPGEDIGGLIGAIRQNPFATRSASASRVFQAIATPNAAAAFPMVTIQNCSVARGQINCLSNGGGLIGYISVANPDATQRVTVARCQANIPVNALGSTAGGFIGFCQYASITQSFASGNVTSTTSGAMSSFLAEALACSVMDCYAIGDCNGGSVAGGIVGNLFMTEVARCYSFGNIIASNAAGGIVGNGVSGFIHDNLVLGGTIQAPTAHRILGLDSFDNTLQNNDALDTVIPVPAVPDPNGVDGGTITSAQIIPTMQMLGWDTTSVWNTATVASLGRPTLLQNPET